MRRPARIFPFILCSFALPALLMPSLAVAQKPVKPAQERPVTSLSSAPGAAPAVSDSELISTQDQLIKLLRLSPTLTTVVEHDPSLLANQDYVNRNNPQLAQFLVSHPEVARNPEFYLFTHLNSEPGRRDDALERAVWPELSQPWRQPSGMERFVDNVWPFLAFICVLSALLWLFYQIVENRRWGRIFKLQSEVHGKLIDKFGNNQELLTYMDTEAGKRFLEAAPIPVGFEPEQRVPNAVARVLTPLQIGIVMALLGVGFFMLRHVRPDRDMETAMLVMGTVFFMPGLGFILSAGITWVLAGRLGLMPGYPETPQRPNLPFNSRDGQ